MTVLGLSILAFGIGKRPRTLAALGRREDDARFRELLEGAPDASLIVDQEGRIQFVNTRAVTLFGYAPEELLGRPLEILVPDRFRETHVRHRVGYAVNPHPRPMGSGLELFARRKDGSELPVEISLGPIRTEKGVLVACSVSDISERKQAEEKIRYLNESLKRRTFELEAANKELEAFSYSVSHDLRAPLRAIDGFGRVLEEDYEPRLDEPGRDHLRRIRAATQHMAQLIDDLLGLAQVTRSGMRRERVDLSGLAKAIAEDLKRTQPEREAEFTITEGLIVNGDARLLRLALENLLGNAWKFTAKKPRARIEFGVTEQEGRPAYFVRDNGAGFDMAYAGKLFGAFQRLHGMKDFPGTGIGLATAQRIMHRHGGRVWAESAVEQGATFYFTLSPEG